MSNVVRLTFASRDLFRGKVGVDRVLLDAMIWLD